MDLLPPEHTRTPISFGGWALRDCSILDQRGSRGLVADVASFPVLKRQATFAVLSAIDPADPAPFLSRLGEPSSSVGDAIRTRHARDLIAAAFNTERVLTGYLRALTRIHFKPMDEPHLYRRLFDIFANEAEEHRAQALRYCGPVTSTAIQVVDVLDPVLICPEIVRSMRSVRQARRTNDLVRFLKSVCSTANDEMLAAGIRQSLGNGGIERFAQRMLQKADRFPAPPLPLQFEFIPLTSAAEMIRLGREMRNCLGSRIPHALLGLAAYYCTEVRVGAGVLPVVVELAPLSNGSWAVEGVFGPGNHKPPGPVVVSLVRRLMALGAVVAMNPAVHRQVRDLAGPLGVYAYGKFSLLALEDEEENDTSEDSLDAAVLDAVLEDVEREFGFA